MTLEEIKAAVKAGKVVHWSSEIYVVKADSLFEEWVIVCVLNDNCTGLTHQDGITMNGEPDEFYIATPKPVPKKNYWLHPTFITVKRTYRETTDTTSLLIKSDKLEVVGVLPHCAEIQFDLENARKLRDWLNETYFPHVAAREILAKYFPELLKEMEDPNWQAGYKACKDGIAHESNPHTTDTPEYKNWQDGWGTYRSTEITSWGGENGSIFDDPK